MVEIKNEYLTVEQVAKLFQVHWQTVLNYIKNGRLKAIKLGKGYRIPKKEVFHFIKVNTFKK